MAWQHTLFASLLDNTLLPQNCHQHNIVLRWCGNKLSTFFSLKHLYQNCNKLNTLFRWRSDMLCASFLVNILLQQQYNKYIFFQVLRQSRQLPGFLCNTLLCNGVQIFFPGCGVALTVISFSNETLFYQKMKHCFIKIVKDEVLLPGDFPTQSQVFIPC